MSNLSDGNTGINGVLPAFATFAGGGSVDAGMDAGMPIGEWDGETDGNFTGTNAGDGTSFQPMTSMPFIIGITALSLIVAVGLGFLLSRLRIKKGLDIYED